MPYKKHSTMGVWCPIYLLHKINGILEGPMYETTLRALFRAACRWTDLKGSKHLDPWMLAIANNDKDAAEGYHHRSCYHIFTFRVGIVTSGVVNLKHGMGSKKTILWRTLYIHPKRTRVKSTSLTNDRHCIMINHLCSPMVSIKSTT